MASKRTPGGPGLTLAGLLHEAQKLYRANAPQEQVLAFVEAAAARAGLRVRHDRTSAEPAAAEPAAEPAVSIRDPVHRYPDGSHRLVLADGHLVLASGHHADRGASATAPGAPATAPVARVLLSGEKRRPVGRRPPLYYECNGLVLDARSWCVLAVPPRAFARPDARTVDGLLAAGRYDVIRIDDGTVLTLYRWHHPADGDVWALASGQGWDVSPLRWMGPLTYAEVVHALAQRLYPAFVEATGLRLERRGGTTRLAFTTLDPARCYTFGIRHHDLHPLRADPERIWQIQWAELAEGLPRVTQGAGLPGLPGQQVLAPAEVAALCGGVPTLAGLQALGRDALARAYAHVAAHACDAQAHDAPACGAAGLHYGFLLRARAPGLDVLVETPLLLKVRRLAYERPHEEVAAEDRLEYNALRAHLAVDERASFLALYPDWRARLQAYDVFVDNVVHLVVHALRQRAMVPASREPALRSATGRVARALLEHIGRHERLAPFHCDTESIVRDYVVNPAYALLFLHALREGAKKKAGPAC
jgi:hypothetical protein